jgi:Methylamine utilisation protein MauE
MTALDPLVIGTAIGLPVFVFARAALHKITDFPEFRQTVIDYRLLPERLAGSVAAALAGAEVLVVVLLLAPAFRGSGALVAALLLVVYGAAMGINLWRGRNTIDCGCGGPGQSISWALVGRNTLLAGLAAPAAAPVSARQLDWFDVALLPTLVVAAWLLLLVFERLAQTFAHIRAVGADRHSL